MRQPHKTLAIDRCSMGLLLLVLCVTLGTGSAFAHDPGTAGGLFRSRDAGASWDIATPLRPIGAAIALAINPTDANDLLLATDGGLLRSRNGGRDWALQTPKSPVGAFAAVFDADGRRALVSTASELLRTDDGVLWRSMAAPRGTVPARAMVRGTASGRVYLAGWKRFAQSDDWGVTWTTAADGLPPGPVLALAVQPGPPETLYAVVEGRIWVRSEGSSLWQSRMEGQPAGQVEAIALDPSGAARLWAAAAGRVFRTDDSGGHWRPSGKPLPTAGTAVHGIAVTGNTIVLTTDRGLYHSADGGETWQSVSQNVPAHLEAGPLLRDPVSPSTLYAGFTLIPYSELWQGAVESRGRLDQIDPRTLRPWAAAVIGALGAAIGARWLLVRRSRRAVPGLPSRQPGLLQSRRVARAWWMSLRGPLQEPLVQFFLIGATFFLLNHWFGGGTDPAGRRIEVLPAQIARLTQVFTEQRGRPPTAEESKSLVSEYVREEIFYREALEMGLDKGDVVVRRRLAQKMATIVDDLEAPGDPTEAELRAFFEFHADRYRDPVRVRFTHLYFDTRRRGASAEAEARAALERLRTSQRLPQSTQKGDSFAPKLGTAMRSQFELAEWFGQPFAETVVTLPAGVWQGPLRSTHGIHLVRVDERSVPSLPTLTAVRDRVVADWRSARREETGAAAWARIRERYEVMITEAPQGNAATAEAGGPR